MCVSPKLDNALRVCVCVRAYVRVCVRTRAETSGNQTMRGQVNCIRFRSVVKEIQLTALYLVSSVFP